MRPTGRHQGNKVLTKLFTLPSSLTNGIILSNHLFSLVSVLRRSFVNFIKRRTPMPKSGKRNLRCSQLTPYVIANIRHLFRYNMFIKINIRPFPRLHFRDLMFLLTRGSFPIAVQFSNGGPTIQSACSNGSLSVRQVGED